MRLLIACLCLCSVSVFANTKVVDEPQVSDVVNTDVKIDSVVFESELYGLSEEETARVRVLKVADRPFGVENLSSLELLGKYARNDTEREDYARRYLEVAAENAIKANMWALTINRVSKGRDFMAEAAYREPEFVRNLELAGMDVSGFSYAKKVENPTKTADIFLSLECGEPCDQEFHELYVNLKARALEQINVVFVGARSADEQAIFDWAREKKIKKSELESASVQLHIDNAHWAVARDGDDVPQVLRSTR